MLPHSGKCISELFFQQLLTRKNRADHKPRQIMKLDYEADYESLTEMLKQLQKTPAKTFDKVNAPPPPRGGGVLHGGGWGWVRGTGRLWFTSLSLTSRSDHQANDVKWGFSGWDKSSPSMKSTASAVRGQSCGNKMGGRLRKADERGLAKRFLQSSSQQTPHPASYICYCSSRAWVG